MESSASRRSFNSMKGGEVCVDTKSQIVKRKNATGEINCKNVFYLTSSRKKTVPFQCAISIKYFSVFCPVSSKSRVCFILTVQLSMDAECLS